MPEIRMTLASDDPEKAVMHFLACPLAEAPAWMKVASDPVAIMAIPDGMKCRGYFFSRRSVAEAVWWDRRLKGGLEWLDDDDLDRINAWIKRRIDRLADEEVPQHAPAPTQIQNLVLSQKWT